MITIFLDIDGVLTTISEFFSSTKEFWEKNPWAKEISIPHPFNEKCVKVLNTILSTFECQIVLTSDWKLKNSLKELDIIFKNFGVIQSPIGVTKNFKDENIDLNRVCEIIHYIANNDNNVDINKYIILDDLNLGRHMPRRMFDNFIETDIETGLYDDEVIDKILEKLKSF